MKFTDGYWQIRKGMTPHYAAQVHDLETDPASVTVEEIREFCKENLAPYKVPTLVEFRAELPKTQVGKVLRRLLVEEEKAKIAAGGNS